MIRLSEKVVKADGDVNLSFHLQILISFHLPVSNAGVQWVISYIFVSAQEKLFFLHYKIYKQFLGNWGPSLKAIWLLGSWDVKCHLVTSSPTLTSHRTPLDTNGRISTVRGSEFFFLLLLMLLKLLSGPNIHSIRCNSLCAAMSCVNIITFQSHHSG